jgi:hypothetical protein
MVWLAGGAWDQAVTLPLPIFSEFHRLDCDTLIVDCCLPQQGVAYVAQVWVLDTADRYSQCMLSGKVIEPNDWIYRPQTTLTNQRWSIRADKVTI